MNPVPLRIGASDQELLATLGVQIVTAGPGAPAEKRRGVLVLAPSAVLIFKPLLDVEAFVFSRRSAARGPGAIRARPCARARA